MSGTYRLTRRAVEDLVAIYISGAEQFGVDQADVYHQDLADIFGFLTRYPRAARLRDEIRPPVRAYPHRSHLIIYDLDDDDTVVILRVRHAKEDWQRDDR
ncbi:MAG: type II toxin-antitoxin system RelE/ParE family toxin [Sphingomonas sp.]